MNREITSTKSDRVAEVRRLHERKHRLPGGAFVVEGPTNVAAAIEANAAISVYATREFRESGHRLLAALDGPLDAGHEVVTVTEAVMDAMSDTRQSQGILAVCRQVALAPTAIAPGEGGHVSVDGVTVRPTGTWVVLDRANDPGNAGTIIRTAEACGATAVLLTEGSVDPHNGKCVRATAGALFRVPVITGVTWDQVRAASGGRPILATTAGGEVTLGTPEAASLLSGPVIWLFGTEAHGLPEAVVSRADARVRIPMPGRAESLNVAAAAAICLFEGQRHRG